MSRIFFDEDFQLQCSRHIALTVNLNRRISDGITDMRIRTSLQAFKTTMQQSWSWRAEGFSEKDFRIWNHTMG
jgi:hypothetical protein